MCGLETAHETLRARVGYPPPPLGTASILRVMTDESLAPRAGATHTLELARSVKGTALSMYRGGV